MMILVEQAFDTEGMLNVKGEPLDGIVRRAGHRECLRRQDIGGGNGRQKAVAAAAILGV